MEFDPLNPSSRSSPDSSDFEKVEKEDVMEAPLSGGVFEADSSTGDLAAAIQGAGDAPAPKSAASSPAEERADLFDFLAAAPAPLLELVYWRRPLRTAAFFGLSLTALLCLACCSLLAVLAYAGLCLLSLTFSFVVYRKCLAAIQKTEDVHPFQAYLGDGAIDAYKTEFEKGAQTVLVKVSGWVVLVRHYLLIVDILDSIKFALFLWFLTYVGAWFNLLTLLILANVSLFTLPKVYEVHREQIDSYVALVSDQIKAQVPILRAKLEDSFGQVWAKIAPYIPGKAKAQ